MSRPIPAHLSHLPVHGGYPLPWVAARGSRGRHVLARSAWPALAPLMIRFELDMENPGPPDFGKYDEARLRRCMVDRRCHVCARRQRHPLLVLPRGITQWFGALPMVVQPWVCAPCLAYSLATCPPLTRAASSNHALVINATEYDLVAWHWGPVDPQDPQPPEGLAVLGGFKVRVRNGSAFPLKEWNASPGSRLRRKLGLAPKGGGRG